MKITIGVKKLTIIIFAVCSATNNLQAMFSCCYSAPDEPSEEVLMRAILNEDIPEALSILAKADRHGEATELLKATYLKDYWSSEGGILTCAVTPRKLENYPNHIMLIKELLKPERPIDLRQRMLCAKAKTHYNQTALISAILYTYVTNTEAVRIIVQAAQLIGGACLYEVLTAIDSDTPDRGDTPLLIATRWSNSLEIIKIITHGMIMYLSTTSYVDFKTHLCQLFPDISVASNVAHQKKDFGVHAFLSVLLQSTTLEEAMSLFDLDFIDGKESTATTGNPLIGYSPRES